MVFLFGVGVRVFVCVYRFFLDGFFFVCVHFFGWGEFLIVWVACFVVVVVVGVRGTRFWARGF